MTRSRKEKVVYWVMLTIAFIAIGIGYIGLDQNQDDIRALAKARAHDNCVVLVKALKPLRDIIDFTTKPADLTGLSGERLEVVTTVNAQRAAARAQLLPLVPDLDCRATRR